MSFSVFGYSKQRGASSPKPRKRRAQKLEKSQISPQRLSPPKNTCKVAVILHIYPFYFSSRTLKPKDELINGHPTRGRPT